MIVSFLIGVFVGAFLGVMMIAVCLANGNDDGEHYQPTEKED